MIRKKAIDRSKIRDPIELDNASFLSQMGIAFLYLFGSFEDSSSPFSDIDLAYESINTLDYFEEAELHHKICTFLNTPEVDIMRFGSLPTFSRYKIITAGKLLFYARPDILARTKESVFLIYFDELLYRNQYLNDFFIKGYTGMNIKADKDIIASLISSIIEKLGIFIRYKECHMRNLLEIFEIIMLHSEFYKYPSKVASQSPTT